MSASVWTDGRLRVDLLTTLMKGLMEYMMKKEGRRGPDYIGIGGRGKLNNRLTCELIAEVTD